MGKKKLLKENESLKLQLENSIKQKVELENKIFNEKINLVKETLETLGRLDWQIEYDTDSNFCNNRPTRRTFTFTLNV